MSAVDAPDKFLSELVVQSYYPARQSNEARLLMKQVALNSFSSRTQADRTAARVRDASPLGKGQGEGEGRSNEVFPRLQIELLTFILSPCAKGRGVAKQQRPDTGARA